MNMKIKLEKKWKSMKLPSRTEEKGLRIHIFYVLNFSLFERVFCSTIRSFHAGEKAKKKVLNEHEKFNAEAAQTAHSVREQQREMIWNEVDQ